MSESLQIFVGIVLFTVTLIAARYLVTWRHKRAVEAIIRDLESKEAIDPARAVDLPYARPSIIRVGLRNYHAPALQALISEGIVGENQAGMYYLRVRPARRV